MQPRTVHPTPPHPTPPHLISPHPTSPHLTLHHVMPYILHCSTPLLRYTTHSQAHFTFLTRPHVLPNTLHIPYHTTHSPTRHIFFIRKHNTCRGPTPYSTPFSSPLFYPLGTLLATPHIRHIYQWCVFFIYSFLFGFV